VTALLLALASSASYGTSDFIASRATKRLSPVLLVLYSQAAQAVVLLVMVLALRQPFAPVGLSWGAAAGALIAIGLLSYYQALATGPTPVVAPLAASGAVVPVVVDLVSGEYPGVPAMVGLVVVPTLVPPELGEREPSRHLHGVLVIRGVLRGDGPASQDGEHDRHDQRQPEESSRHGLSGVRST
jgi:uncharacterized membrane protein